MKNSVFFFRMPALILFFAIIFHLLSGCSTIAKQHLDRQYETPIDWGLKSGFPNAISIEPFSLPPGTKPEWSAWAALHMQQHLLEEKAFTRVVMAGTDEIATPYILRGEITQLYYGGTYTPSRVDAIIRIIATADGQTRFLRLAHITGEKKGINIQMLTRAYVSSPYPEELLDRMLKEIAQDIAQRTHGTE